MIKHDYLNINNKSIPTIYSTAVIVGTGCAGLNAADTLWTLGVKDIVIISNNIYAGTSRNTGSDKQTFYKLSQSGKEQDSIYAMAKNLFDGGGMHGDHALIEAALSCRNFYKLVSLGVPFPHDKYGTYIGYRTDHDNTLRATSAGPLTSKYMTESLENSVKSKSITIIDDMQLIKILVDNNEAYGLIALSKDGYKIIYSPNIILATGGPADIYRDSVYPHSQIGATGYALDAGCEGANLTEWQYGIASIKFRWNLSGTYQQVVPKYISTDIEGKNHDFIFEHFETKGKAIDAIFLKGYQWPFDAKKLKENGSSNIDLLVYEEIYKKNRRVWLDYTQNMCEEWFSLLSEEGKNYLVNSRITEEDNTPIKRLKKINPQAYELYKNNGIDLEQEKLEIALCAQHNNGGLRVDINWQSNVKGVFPIGEAAGIYGIYRPGGTALNSTQTGAVRCAEYIKAKRNFDYTNHKEKSDDTIKRTISIGNKFLENKENCISAHELNKRLKRRMSEKAGAIRSITQLKEALSETKEDYYKLMTYAQGDLKDLPMFYTTQNNLITQICYISAMIYYIESGGTSRGSYLITKSNGNLDYKNKQLVTRFESNNITNYWEDLRPIPEYEIWFENIWRDYREGNLFN